MNLFAMNASVTYTYVDSPVGSLLLYGRHALEGLVFPSGKYTREPDPSWTADPDPFTRAREQLSLYFEGRLKVFDLDLEMAGTPFQKKVWQALTRIPYGATITYGELAREIGNPKGSRAVGLANGKNPIPIIVPCHRVIGKNGSLTGFGGGLPVKRFLLELEQSHG